MSSQDNKLCPCPLHPAEQLMEWLGGCANAASHAGRTSIMVPDEMYDRASIHVHGFVAHEVVAEACRGPVRILKGGWTDEACDAITKYELARDNNRDDADTLREAMLQVAPWIAGSVVRDTNGLLRACLRLQGLPDDGIPPHTCVSSAAARGRVH